MLGDNPFFGVDHLSHERARQRASRYQTFEGAVKVIETAHQFERLSKIVTL